MNEGINGGGREMRMNNVKYASDFFSFFLRLFFFLRLSHVLVHFDSCDAKETDACVYQLATIIHSKFQRPWLEVR